jgi:SAM-dependent methyltransferase
MLQRIKSIIKPFYWFVNEHKLYRRLRTSNYTSGRVILGERNIYKIDRSWVTVDVDGADFNVVFGKAARLPFADNSQSIIYSSHMIEHLDDAALGALFEECFRVLRPGGHLRVEAPDSERIIDAYRTNDEEFVGYFCEENKRNLILDRGFPSIYGEEHIGILGLLSCYQMDGCHVPAIATKEEFDRRLQTLSLDDFGKWCVSLQTGEQQSSHGHINTIYFDKLDKLLSPIGFKNIVRKQNRESNIPNLNLKGIERAHRAFYSLYVEASK